MQLDVEVQPGKLESSIQCSGLQRSKAGPRYIRFTGTTTSRRDAGMLIFIASSRYFIIPNTRNGSKPCKEEFVCPDSQGLHNANVAKITSDIFSVDYIDHRISNLS